MLKIVNQAILIALGYMWLQRVFAGLGHDIPKPFLFFKGALFLGH